MQAEDVRPHVVVLPMPNAQGHINPMMQLAKRLAARGVLVTFITIEHAVARLLQAAADHPQTTREDQKDGIQLIGVPDGLPPEAERHVVSAEYIGMLERVGLETEARLRSLMQDPLLPPVTCVLADIFLESAPPILDRLQLPRCCFWPMSASVLSIHTLLSTFRSNGFDPLEREVAPFSPMDTSESAYVTCIPGISMLHKNYFPYYTGLGDITVQAQLKWLQNTIDHINDSVCILGNDIKGLEPKQCVGLGPKFCPVGPLIDSSFLGDSTHEGHKRQGNSSSFWKEDYVDCMDWLNSRPQSSVVYVSFGSLTRLSKVQTLEVARGLLLSKCSFLWVIRKDALIEPLSNISEALPENFFDLTKDQGKVVHWAPQMDVLLHKAVGGFFSHCGWNSVLETIVAGLPMLAWPQIADQVTNCWMMVHEWKIGLELKRDFDNKPAAKEVAEAVTTLMEGSEAQSFRVRASALQENARREMLNGCSKENLDMFIDKLYAMAVSKSGANGSI